MLLAPMIGVLEPCIWGQPALPGALAGMQEQCRGAQGSAAALVESTLRTLQPEPHAAASVDLGYTLPVPLLKLFERTQDGGWRIDQAIVDRLVRTLRDTPRPAILYLFSTHFSSEAPIEPVLAADPSNMGWTRDGPLGMDDYYDSKVFNWSFATTRNALTERRAEAVRAVVDAACRLPGKDRAKIRGITLLGELHHLFPNFQAGMGFGGTYRITDYSPASVEGFRGYLRAEFRDIAQFNRAVGADYASFDEVAPRRATSGRSPCAASRSTSMDSPRARCRWPAGPTCRAARRSVLPACMCTAMANGWDRPPCTGDGRTCSRPSRNSATRTPAGAWTWISGGSRPACTGWTFSWKPDPAS